MDGLPWPSTTPGWLQPHEVTTIINDNLMNIRSWNWHASPNNWALISWIFHMIGFIFSAPNKTKALSCHSLVTNVGYILKWKKSQPNHITFIIPPHHFPSCSSFHMTSRWAFTYSRPNVYLNISSIKMSARLYQPAPCDGRSVRMEHVHCVTSCKWSD